MVHNPGQLLDGPLGGHDREGPINLGEIDSLSECRRPPVLLRHRRDDRDLLGRDGAVGEG